MKRKKVLVFLLVFIILLSTQINVFSENIKANNNIGQNIIDSNEMTAKTLPTMDKINDYIDNLYKIDSTKMTFSPLEKQVIARYKTVPLKIGLYEWDPYFIDLNGTYAGLNYYIAEEFKKLYGIKTEIVTGSFKDIKDKLMNGEVDIVPGLFMSEIDNCKSLSSAPYYLDMPCVYTNDMKLKNIEIETLQNIRLGKRRQNGYFNEEDINYLAKNNIHMNIVNFDSDLDLINALKTGKCDYIIGSMSAVYLSSGLYRTKLSEPELGKLHYIGVANKKGNDALVSILNQFLNADVERNINRYMSTFNEIRLKNGDFFTTDENALLSKNDFLISKSLTDIAYPDVYLDSSTHLLNGKEVGVFDMICKLLKINYTNTIGTSESTNQALADLNNGDLDVVLGVPDSLDRGGITTPTKAITTSNFCVVGFKSGINSYSDIFNANVGLIEGQIKEKYLQKLFPSKEFEVYTGQNSAINALKNGDVDYLIINEDYYKYLVYLDANFTLKNLLKIDLPYNSVINFDSSNEGRLYASIFSKSLEFINTYDSSYDTAQLSDSEIIKSIKNKYLKSILQVAFPVVLVIVILLIIFYLKQRKKTKDFKLFEERYSLLLKATNSYFIYGNDDGDGVIVNEDLIEHFQLHKLRLVERKNRFTIKFNDSLEEFFVDRNTLLDINVLLNEIKQEKVDKSSIEFYFVKGNASYDIAKVKLTLWLENNAYKNKVYGIFQDITEQKEKNN